MKKKMEQFQNPNGVLSLCLCLQPNKGTGKYVNSWEYQGMNTPRVSLVCWFVVGVYRWYVHFQALTKESTRFEFAIMINVGAIKAK